jgi:GNAT superfamily N-acetyltransferase
MEATTHIREAITEDIPQLMELYTQLSIDGCDKMPIGEAQALFDKIASYPDYRIYLAEISGEAVGTFALLIMDSLGHMGVPTAVLEDVVVSEQCRGQGVGQQMVAFATDLCREKGCSKFFFSSSMQRKAAHKFYEDLGFAKHGFSFYLDYQQKDE